MKREDVDIILSQNLKRLRNERGLTQEQLAEALNVSQGIITVWETGRKGIGKDVLAKLCEYFNVKPFEFYTEHDTPIIKDESEKKLLEQYRQDKDAGVAQEIINFREFLINKKKAEKADEKDDRQHPVNMRHYPKK